MIKPDIKGAAAFMHGYVALEGLGITRIKNQIVDSIPNKIKAIRKRRFLFLAGNLT
jgi:hypothetical protein